MSRRRRRRSKKGSPLATMWQKLRDWRPTLPWDLGSIQQETVGLVLLIVATLSVLGLSNISSGALLDWSESCTLSPTPGTSGLHVKSATGASATVMLWVTLSVPAALPTVSATA